MYLSRLAPDMRHRQARHDLANPYEMHRTLSRAVAHGLDRGEERLLWRAEVDRHGAFDHVLVQTLTQPDWSFLDAGYARSVATKAFDVPAVRGMAFRFRLRANPTVRREGKRHALYDYEERRAWLERKAVRAGFRLSGLRFGAEERLAPRKDGRTMTLFAATFDGSGIVAEPVAFQDALRSGIGPAKALGMGLLSVAPA